MYITFTVAVWFILNYITNSMNATLPVTDSAILILSILAQSLLDQKKIETWAIWFAVNVFAIYTYYNSELYMVALQYVVFLMNTLYGTYAWIKTMGDKEIETV
jgi:nicotinamide mononucleotide transporter